MFRILYLFLFLLVPLTGGAESPASVDQLAQAFCLRELPSQAFSAKLTEGTPTQYERKVEVLNPGGSLCPAEVKLFCGGKIVTEKRLPTGEGKVRWPYPCVNASLSGRCTQGAFEEFSGTGGMPDKNPFNFTDWVLYAGNNPNVDDGTLEIEIPRTESGARAATIEILGSGKNKTLATLRTLGGKIRTRLDAGDYDVRATLVTTSEVATNQVHIKPKETLSHTMQFPAAGEESANKASRPILQKRVQYPQLAVQLCNQDNHPLSFNGEALLMELDRPSMRIIPVRGGRFELGGLERGTYLIQFAAPDFQLQRVIPIPLGGYLPGETGSSLVPSLELE